MLCQQNFKEKNDFFLKIASTINKSEFKITLLILFETKGRP